MVLSPLQVIAEEDCDSVIEAANKAIKNQAELISLQSDQIESLRFDYNVVKAQLKETDSWYRQPSIVVPLSFIAGALVTGYLGRK